MKIGIGVKNFGWSGDVVRMSQTLRGIAQRADASGFDSLWVMDHLFQIPIFGTTDDVQTEPMLESTTTLAFIAAWIERIRIGAMVTSPMFRHPAVLIKSLTALDVLSCGRAYFGIGAGWNEAEHRGLGVPFPPLAERFERLEEILQIARQMWAGETTAFRGTHYTLEQPINSPNSYQRPHPPIMIGGGGERKTLRLVARYGDACNFVDSSPEGVSHKLDVLRSHCEDLGRPYEEIEKTVFLRINQPRDGQDVESIVRRLRELGSLGIDHAMFDLQPGWPDNTLGMLGKSLIPRVHAIPVAGR